MNKCSYIITVLLSVACSQSYRDATEEISFYEFSEKTFHELPENVFDAISYTPVSSDSIQYLFSSPDKIVVADDKMYVNDWASRKLFTYSQGGAPISVLYKKGRAAGEYLQISDFDVDRNGDVWVVDGQTDYLMHYTAQGTFVDSKKLPFEADHIKCLDDGRFLFAIAQYDESKYKDSQLVKTDSDLNVDRLFAKRLSQRDPNYEFIPSYGLHSYGDHVFFHKPICDDVYCINQQDMTERIYHFNFGKKAVPDEARKDTEPYIDEFESYTALGSAVYVDDNLAIGGVVEGMQMKSFIIDRKNNVKYVQSDVFSSMLMLGMSDGYIIFLLMPDAADGLHFLPSRITERIKNDDIVIARLPLDELHAM